MSEPSRQYVSILLKVGFLQLALSSLTSWFVHIRRLLRPEAQAITKSECALDCHCLQKCQDLYRKTVDLPTSLTHKLATLSYTHTIFCSQHKSLQAWHSIQVRFRVSLYKSKYGRQYFPPLSATTHRASRRDLELLSPASGERNGLSCPLGGLR